MKKFFDVLGAVVLLLIIAMWSLALVLAAAALVERCITYLFF